MSQPSSPAAVVIDANVLISICSNEATFNTAADALAKYAPTVMVNLLPM